jgi:hypothetical protein
MEDLISVKIFYGSFFFATTIIRKIIRKLQSTQAHLINTKNTRNLAVQIIFSLSKRLFKHNSNDMYQNWYVSCGWQSLLGV